jgi:hypothetical protein
MMAGLFFNQWRVFSKIGVLVLLPGLALPAPHAWAVDEPSQPRPQPSASPTQRLGTQRLGKELKEIPQRPSAPPLLQTEGPADTFKCERTFVYRGKPLICDSYMRQDAERLRPILSSVPTAVAELDSYQRNRRKVTTLAYVASAGLVLLLGSRLLPQSSSNSLITPRNIGLYGGMGLAAGSVLYGLSFLRTNEAHLGNAVEYYNRAHPRDPIELQFSTGITF